MTSPPVAMLAAAMLLVACTASPGSAPRQETGAIQVAVNAVPSSVEVTRVAVNVSPAGMSRDLTYVPQDGSFQGSLTGVAIGAQTVSATAFAGTSQVGSASAQVQVTTGQVAQVTLTLVGSTGPAAVPDHAPVITDLVVTPSTVAVGGRVSLSASGVDLDGDPLSWSWSTAPSGCGTFGSPAGATTFLTASAAGACTVQVALTANGKTDTRRADIAITGSGGTFPLTPSANGRYLVDGAGNPFFLVGDAAQSAAAALTLAQFQSYLDTRVSQGFNTVNVNFIEHLYAPAAPSDRSGNAPFATPGNFSTPNDVYFAGLEQKVAYAARKGVLVSLAFYVSGGGHAEGWYNELVGSANTQAVCNAFGQYLANGHGGFGGLKQYANVIWTWGADWLFTTDTEARNRLRQIAQGLKDAGSTQLMSGDWGIPGVGQGLATTQSGFKTYMDLESVYAYTNNGDIVATSRNAWSYVPSSSSGDGRALPALPSFMKETGYEGETNPRGDAASVRAYGWEAILNGCTAGYWYGHRDIWNFAFATQGYAGAGLFPPYTIWSTSVTSAGAQDMARLAALLKTLAWHKLVPSGAAAPFAGRVLVPGNDTAIGGNVSAAQASDGTLLLAYLPSTGAGAQSLTVDPRSLSPATLRARFWDPTSGAFTAAGTIPNTATRAFTTPGINAAGANDWLLILDLPTVSGALLPTKASLRPGAQRALGKDGHRRA